LPDAPTPRTEAANFNDILITFESVHPPRSTRLQLRLSRTLKKAPSLLFVAQLRKLVRAENTTFVFTSPMVTPSHCHSLSLLYHIETLFWLPPERLIRWQVRKKRTNTEAFQRLNA
jgi:hypothetical protein